MGVERIGWLVGGLFSARCGNGEFDAIRISGSCELHMAVVAKKRIGLISYLIFQIFNISFENLDICF